MLLSFSFDLCLIVLFATEYFWVSGVCLFCFSLFVNLSLFICDWIVFFLIFRLYRCCLTTRKRCLLYLDFIFFLVFDAGFVIVGMRELLWCFDCEVWLWFVWLICGYWLFAFLLFCYLRCFFPCCCIVLWTDLRLDLFLVIWFCLMFDWYVD